MDFGSAINLVLINFGNGLRNRRMTTAGWLANTIIQPRYIIERIQFNLWKYVSTFRQTAGTAQSAARYKRCFWLNDDCVED